MTHVPMSTRLPVRRATAAAFAALLLWGGAAFGQEPASPPALLVEPLLIHITESEEGIVTVSEVDSGGPAAELDIRAGDVIVGVEDTSVNSYNDLVSGLSAAQPGQEITLLIRSDGEPIELRLVAAAEPGEKFKAIVERRQASMFGMALRKDRQGRAVVRKVSPESPAEAAGIKPNDIVVNFGGHQVRSFDGLVEFANELTGKLDPGAELELIVVRGDERETLLVVLPDATGASPAAPDEVPIAAAEAELVFCMAVRESAGDRVTVVDCMQESPPALAGILPGDSIVSVADQKIHSIADLSDAIAQQTPGDRVPFGILRQGELQITEVVMAPCRDDESPAADAATLDALESQIRLLDAQVEELRRTVDVLRGTLETIRAGQAAE